jgi:hypothetical protein
LGDDRGITIIEVTIAAMLLAISSLAVLGLVDAANRNNFRSEQSQIVNDILQREMEAIKQRPYFEVALSGVPASSGDPQDPDFRVEGATFNVNQTGAANYQGLVYNNGRAPSVSQGSDGSLVAGGTVDPGPSPFESGNIKGDIHRYITWERDAACDNCAVKWHRHIVIAVTLDDTAAGGERAYQEIHGTVSNPNAGLPPSQGGPGAGGPGEGGGGGGTGGGGGGGGPGPGDNDQTPWTFWLTDTPCIESSRQPITADHETHNTLDGCGVGMQTGAVPGAPDLMFTRAAPLNNEFPDNQQPLYDYATDVEPAENPDQDRGLQVLTPPDPAGLGCTVDVASLTGATGLNALGPLTGPTPWQFVHKWVSPPVPEGYGDIVLEGTGALDLWTRSINGASYPGKICVWLFVRNAGVDSLAVNLDQPTHLTSFSYSSQDDSALPSRPYWPFDAWTEIHLPVHFGALDAEGALVPLRIPAGARLGLAIGVERAGTAPNTGLQFMYDSPSFDSRLEVDTRSLVPVFPGS